MLEKRDKLLFGARKFKILCHKKHFCHLETKKKMISEKVGEKIQIHFFDKVIHENKNCLYLSIKDVVSANTLLRSLTPFYQNKSYYHMH